jgi:hypothetical protein
MSAALYWPPVSQEEFDRNVEEASVCSKIYVQLMGFVEKGVEVVDRRGLTASPPIDSRWLD